MLSAKYHLATIVAIFFALGIGFLMGGTLGQQWVMQTESALINKLLVKYEEKSDENMRLQNQIVSLKLLHQAINPLFQDKEILWIRPEGEKNSLLSLAMESLGARWEEHIPPFGEMAGDHPLRGEPDLLIVSDPGVIRTLDRYRSSSRFAGGMSGTKIVVFGENGKMPEDAKSVVNLVLFLKKVMEEDSYASVGFYRYSGLE